jgi:hypothetical protein
MFSSKREVSASACLCFAPTAQSCFHGSSEGGRRWKKLWTRQAGQSFMRWWASVAGGRVAGGSSQQPPPPAPARPPARPPASLVTPVPFRAPACPPIRPLPPGAARLSARPQLSVRLSVHPSTCGRAADPTARRVVGGYPVSRAAQAPHRRLSPTASRPDPDPLLRPTSFAPVAATLCSLSRPPSSPPPSRNHHLTHCFAAHRDCIPRRIG